MNIPPPPRAPRLATTGVMLFIGGLTAAVATVAPWPLSMLGVPPQTAGGFSLAGVVLCLLAAAFVLADRIVAGTADKTEGHDG
jgi:hypothetical protein